jgi:predicted DCC family thiol-disulfide oxidoreductase YuxK
MEVATPSRGNEMSYKLLVYDPSCSFCVGLAERLGKDYDIEIMPNDHPKLPAYVNRNEVGRDVHYFLQYRRMNLTPLKYTGAQAAIEILSIKHPRLASICRLPVIRQLLGALYFIVKKSRKFL